MHDKIVRRMHEVFGYGLDLKERLERGESPTFVTEHARLLSLLLAGGELDFDPAYRGDLASPAGRANMTRDLSNLFLGVQYALACWLDEVFLLDAPSWWGQQWETDSLEVRLYGGSQERAWRFWDQARKAEGPRGSPEALEAFLWCVMLGFKGAPDTLNPPVNPPVWVDNVRKRVLSARSAEFPTPAQKEAPTRVPALRGPDRLKTMLRVAVVVGAAAMFALGIALVKYFSKV
ncbi:MAG TPA: DotU family type IV/VI secretion system protein [Fimbriiglobus sp.]|nr:DotU family type IV/VI secretion system protein [Fimbriiglobus sp.]